MSHLVHNEQVKLEAKFLNNIGVGVFLAGAILPMLTDAIPPGATVRVVLLIGAILLGWGLHWAARWHLKNLRED
jgi:hypothetical protein